MKYDFKVIYQDRIINIDIDLKKAIRKREWHKVKQLRSEKAQLEEILNKRSD